MTRNDSPVATMGWGLPRPPGMRERLVGVLISSHEDLEDAHYNDVVDRLLKELEKPTPSMLAAATEPYRHDKPLHPSHGIKSAGQLPAWHLVDCAWQAMIRAIKEGK